MTLHVGSVGSPIRANTYEPEVLRQFMAMEAGSSPAAGLAQGIVGAGSFAVTQNGTPNMSVNVAAGFGIVAGTNNPPVQGVYNVYNDAPVNLALAASNATNPRIDVVCVTIQDAYYSGSTNTGLLQVITGTPAASPTVPSIPANSLALAHIYVGANVSSIDNAHINSTAGTNNPDTIAFTPIIHPRIGVLAAFAGTAASGSCASGASPGVQLVSLVVNVNPGRKLRIIIEGRVNNSSNVWNEIHRDSVGVGFTGTPGAGGNTMSYFCQDSPSAGLHTYSWWAWGASAGTTYVAGGSGTVIDQWGMTVEDIGPTS